MALLWLLLACGLTLVLQGLILGRSSLRKLTYERHFSTEACYTGDRIEMVEIIENGKILPVPWLRLEAMLPSSLIFKRSREMTISEGNIYQNHTSLFTIRPRTRITRTHQIQCVRRGIYRIDSATMTGGDLFALFTPTRQIVLGRRLVVYPALLGEDELPSSWKTWQGELAVRRWIVQDPFLITGIRSYAPGDSMNRIHWKATARTGELQVHQNGFTADPQVMILLNVEESEHMWNVVTRPEIVEEAFSYAGTCAASLIHQGMAAGFGHNAWVRPENQAMLRLEPDYGAAQLEQILEAMAAAEMKIRMSFFEYLRLEAGREHETALDYLLVTAHVSEPVREGIRLLEQQGHRVTLAGWPGDKEAAV
ncbi:DUF58 domain-containing protein [Paenibacillus physcomitrellae]|uniref:DUF58 domain-containing protein n=1 Tax=Paenibacillus physcomitrellae TaxID=1619311 RepID=A0ABQ1G2S2_9BACL|nr:DUF58 domain-containing protein [Paenibacillus physcomitrellae]GGA35503.1 hypothetical protein GCM10010917_20900 [Paenibacillus physcomitrellae]